MVFLDVLVRVPLHVSRPAAGHHGDESHAAFHQSPSQQTSPCVVVRWFATDAVQVQCFFRFAGDLEHFRSGGLHFERQFVGQYPCREFVVFGFRLSLIQPANQVYGLLSLVERDARRQLEIANRCCSGPKHGGLIHGR